MIKELLFRFFMIFFIFETSPVPFLSAGVPAHLNVIKHIRGWMSIGFPSQSGPSGTFRGPKVETVNSRIIFQPARFVDVLDSSTAGFTGL